MHFHRVHEFFHAYSTPLLLVSVGVFIIALLTLPLLVAQIPPDYFSHPHRQRMARQSRHPLVSLLLITVKNLLGVLLLLVGIVMLFTPGQGLLTLLSGLVLMDYPGKYALERWLVLRPGVLRALNWLRARGGHRPLQPPAGFR